MRERLSKDDFEYVDDEQELREREKEWAKIEIEMAKARESKKEKPEEKSEENKLEKKEKTKQNQIEQQEQKQVQTNSQKQVQSQKQANEQSQKQVKEQVQKNIQLHDDSDEDVEDLYKKIGRFLKNRVIVLVIFLLAVIVLFNYNIFLGVVSLILFITFSVFTCNKMILEKEKRIYKELKDRYYSSLKELMSDPHNYELRQNVLIYAREFYSFYKPLTVQDEQSISNDITMACGFNLVTNSTENNDSMDTQLQKIKDLKQKGIISDDEYEYSKKIILSKINI